ncbi:cytochrome oxidase small assembly protein [Pandoraea sp.]|nr:cytochrome oxidase small assembly protein [Pandoraea sp.]MBU6492269.1 cytochrome oxidase small assembly protein [Burkholderiales bacterium]MDE2288084.1 cytochrome oxidase small assembly protein [Burkholderiales bacterium]MDE2611635.1 cytochrome oxidase small assembly protein [Burkholderiales bacterium]
MVSQQEEKKSRQDARARNIRLAWILVSIVAIFFFGVMVKVKLLGF